MTYRAIDSERVKSRRSLRTSVKAVALKKLRGILEKADYERDLDLERVSWKAAVQGWREHAIGGLKADTFDRYVISLANVRPILDDLYVDQIGISTIGKISRHRKEDGVTNATIRRDLTAVSSVLAFCCGQGWLATNAARAYDRSIIRERRDPIVLPNETDIDAIVALAPGNMARLIRYAQYSGARQMEIVTLEHGQLRDGKTDLWKSKTDKPRVLENDDRAWGTLEGTEKHADSKWVFWHARKDGEPKPYRNLASRFGALMRRAVKNKKVKRAFRFHDLRHWFAVDYLRSGGNIYRLQKHLGHGSLTTTEIYLSYLTPEEHERAKYGAGGTRGAQ